MLSYPQVSGSQPAVKATFSFSPMSVCLCDSYQKIRLYAKSRKPVESLADAVKIYVVGLCYIRQR